MQIFHEILNTEHWKQTRERWYYTLHIRNRTLKSEIQRARSNTPNKESQPHMVRPSLGVFFKYASSRTKGPQWSPQKTQIVYWAKGVLFRDKTMNNMPTTTISAEKGLWKTLQDHKRLPWVHLIRLLSCPQQNTYFILFLFTLLPRSKMTLLHLDLDHFTQNIYNFTPIQKEDISPKLFWWDMKLGIWGLEWLGDLGFVSNFCIVLKFSIFRIKFI